MLLISHSVSVLATAEHVWTKLLDWQHWPSWDTGMESVSFDGPIDVGSIGRLKLKGGPAVALHVTTMNEGRDYSDYMDLWGTRFTFHHYLEYATNYDGNAQSDIVTVRFSVEADGATAFLVGNLMRGPMASQLPGWMENFKRLCETT